MPETKVRRGLHRLGFRFRLHRSDLPGKPDVVLKRYRAVILVHGCFWHGHQGCRNFRIPKTNRDFWESKITGNIERDASQVAALLTLGWRVLIVWECSTRDMPGEELAELIGSWLGGSDNIGEIPRTV